MEKEQLSLKGQLLFEQWKMASELQRHEDNLLWQRFSYFVTLTGVLVSGLGVVLTNSRHPYRFLVIISFLGALVSLEFAFVFRRAYLFTFFAYGKQMRPNTDCNWSC
jgi:hypothetical protein